MASQTHASHREPEIFHSRGFTPTTEDLIRVARISGRPGATLSTIRHWRSQRLLSAPFPHQGKWRYPLETIGEVDLLARYGRRGLGDDLYDLARYIETRVGDPAAVKDACIRLLGSGRQEAERLAALGAGGREGLRAEASELARQRSNAFFPREVRMSLEQRIDIHEFLLDKLADVEVDPEFEMRGLEGLARGLGAPIRTASDADELREVIREATEAALDIDVLIAAVRAASPELAELARRSVAYQHLWMPAMFAASWDEIPPSEAKLLRVAEAIAAIQSPAMYPVAYAAALVRKGHEFTAAEIVQRAGEPSEALAVAALIAEEDDYEGVLAKIAGLLRPYPRVQLRVAVAELNAGRAAAEPPDSRPGGG